MTQHQTSYMLSEVLREREAQMEHVARKKELVQMQDERFLKLQSEVSVCTTVHVCVFVHNCMCAHVYAYTYIYIYIYIL